MFWENILKQFTNHNSRWHYESIYKRREVEQTTLNRNYWNYSRFYYKGTLQSGKTRNYEVMEAQLMINYYNYT